MSVWSKVLIGLILVATLPYFYLSLRLLKTNQSFRSKVNDYTKAVRTVEDGRPGQQSLAVLDEEVKQAQVALHDIVADRGRVWRNARTQRAFNANTGAGTVLVDAPSPSQITQKMVLFAFDPEGYLGEFQVVNDPGAGQEVQLEPNMKMTERQLKRVSSSSGIWSLYEVMPLDRHDLFAGFDKETLSKMLPEDRVNAFLHDGQPAEPTDPASSVMNGKYRRPLTDFTLYFHDMDRQISVARDLNTAATKDLASLNAAVADANQQIAFRSAEKAELKAELDRSIAERDLIKAQYVALEKQLTSTRSEMKRLFNQNRAMAKELEVITTGSLP